MGQESVKLVQALESLLVSIALVQANVLNVGEQEKLLANVVRVLGGIRRSSRAKLRFMQRTGHM